MTADVAQLESALLLRVRRGDDDALGSLYDRMAAPAYGLSLRITRDNGLAQDAVQEAFVRVWERASQFDPGRGAARAWILRIVRNASLDTVRREGTRRRAHDEAKDAPTEPPPVSADEALDRERSLARLDGVLGQLPGEQRRLIEIAYFEGLSQSEIASREGIPLGTVKSRMRTGIDKLRRAAAQGQLHGA